MKKGPRGKGETPGPELIEAIRWSIAEIGKGYIPGRIGGDNKVLDRWSNYASENSYHPSRSEKAGGLTQDAEQQHRAQSSIMR